MSDLKPSGVVVELGGQEHKILFTINAIEEIQSSCNKPLYDAMEFVVKAACGDMSKETLVTYRSVVTALLNAENNGNLTEKEVGEMVTLENYTSVAQRILNAFGISNPDPDEGDDEDDDPKAETGQ